MADALTHTDRRVDGQDEGNWVFREYKKVAKKVKFVRRKTGGISNNMGGAVKC